MPQPVPRAACCVVGFAQRQQPLLDPVVQGQIARGLRGGRQQQRDGLGEIAHRVIALAEQPFGNSGFLDGPLGQLARFKQPLGPPADQERSGPGRIGGRPLAK